MIGRYERSRYRQKYRRLGLLMDDALTIYPLGLLRFNSRARALEFTILTAARSGKVWTVPAARMKGGREHRIALRAGRWRFSKSSKARTSEYVFTGQRPGTPLSGMAREMILRRMKIDSATVHGFRSSFRDWCGEVSTFPREVAEAALARVAGDQTERAYRRGDALEKQRALMEA